MEPALLLLLPKRSWRTRTTRYTKRNGVERPLTPAETDLTWRFVFSTQKIYLLMHGPAGPPFFQYLGTQENI